ncbi:MAG: hypothetical protein HC904_11720 [Blastochloris sp.]|nr:hypothetical protein [Blastochloris sp.]
MRHILTTLAAALLLTGSLLAGNSEINTAGATGIAINGYDPVAFFTEKKPVNGDPAIKVEHAGATYLFSTEKHRDLFAKNPEKYAPQFGGYCAYGVSVNALFPVDISTWQVRDGKLYLNLNPEILKAFNKDFEGNVAKAHTNWPKVLNASKY